MDRFMITFALVAGSIAVAAVVNRRRSVAPLSVRRGSVPTRVLIEDVGLASGPGIVIFTEASCRSCQQAIALVRGPAGARLPVAEIEYREHGPLHSRYGIDTVPTTIVVDGEGVVVGGWTGRIDPGALATALAEVV